MVKPKSHHEEIGILAESFRYSDCWTMPAPQCAAQGLWMFCASYRTDSND
jgi:hypothetical protein